MLVIENCNSLSELRQKLIDGEEVRTVRDKPCEDAIRREDAITAVSEALEHVFVENEDIAKKMINKLPPVNPQPKTGHWIRELIRNEKGGCIGAKMICSECGNDNKHDEYMIYCPNCGAKMDERREVRYKV